MPEPVRTTLDAGPSRSSARADGSEHVLVVVPAAAARRADPRARQALAAASEAPWTVVQRHAERDLPIPIGSAVNPAQAGRLRTELATELDLEVAVLEREPTARAGLATALGVTAVTAGFLGTVMALVAFLVGSGMVMILAAFLGLVTLGSGVAALAMLRGVSDQSEAVHEARRFRDEADERRAGAEALWSRLDLLRRASLDEELPPTAQADLWVALEALEAQLLAGDHEGVAAELEAAEAALDGEDVDAGRLTDAARAARQALVETGEARDLLARARRARARQRT